MKSTCGYKFLYIIALFFTVSSFLYGQTITSSASGGNWNDTGTWVGGVVPSANNDVVIASTVSVTEAAYCRAITIQSNGVLQNGGGLGWVTLYVHGNITNNGIIRNNPSGNFLELSVVGNIHNAGVWECRKTYLSGENNHTMYQATGKYFNTEIVLDQIDDGNSAIGTITLTSDVTFYKRVSLYFYQSGNDYVDGTLNAANHSISLVGEGRFYRGTVSNVQDLTMSDNAYLEKTIFQGAINLKGVCQISVSDVIFNGNVTVHDVLQNSGGLGWITPVFNGNVTNNGEIRSNPDGNRFEMMITGDIHNNGIWSAGYTYLSGEDNHILSQTSGKYFDTQIRLDQYDNENQAIGTVTLSSDVTFHNRVDLYFYQSGNDYVDGTLNAANHSISLVGDGKFYRGIVSNVKDLMMSDDAFIERTIFQGAINLKGVCQLSSSDVMFNGDVTIHDVLQNSGGLGWITPVFNGNVTNNGEIRSSPDGNRFEMMITGDIHNNGIWSAGYTYLSGEDNHILSQTSGKYFDTQIRLDQYDTENHTIGTVTLSSDVTFHNKVDLYFYQTGVGYVEGKFDAKNNSVFLVGDGKFYRGTVSNVKDLVMSEDAFIERTTFEGDINLKGVCQFSSSDVVFYGTVVNFDTLRNTGGLGWINPKFYGTFINNGYIHNNPNGNRFEPYVYGNVYNYGYWGSGYLYVKTDGKNVNMSGDFDCIVYFEKTGNPAGGDIIIDAPTIIRNDPRYSNDVVIRVLKGASLKYLEQPSGAGSVVNNGDFITTNTLAHDGKIPGGMGVDIYLRYRGELTYVEATFHNNQSHPEANSSINQWWEVEGFGGDADEYFLTFTYDEKQLKGYNENDLQVYNSKDGGITWDVISTPVATERDTVANTIVIGNYDYPLSGDFGHYMIASSNEVFIPSISMAIGGRKDIRVGPPNMYTITYWNNSDFETDMFFLNLKTNNGVFIESIVTTDIETGDKVTIPWDSLSYEEGRNDLVLFMQPLAPKEVREFDVILTAIPDTRGQEEIAEPLTFAGILLWTAAAAAEEYISNTVVEGCYEMWRPVRHDQSLMDASQNALKNSLNKAVTVENGVKGIAKKGAEEIIKKTGRVVAWPVFLAKDVFDCLGNTIRGMKDYVNGNFDEQSKGLRKVTSWDPNAKEGPTGFGEKGYMATTAPMNYTIFFENKKEATAAAWKIVIIDTLDEKVFDIESVEFGAMSHSMGTYKREGNILTWEFVEIELPPNVTPPEGEGWVKFTVHLKEDLPTGTEIKNRAIITFDLNEPIATNLFVNTLDFDAPETKDVYVEQLYQHIRLTWNPDDKDGSGTKKSLVFTSINDGPYTLAGVAKGNVFEMPVLGGYQYKYYVLSEDYVGNAETEPTEIVNILTDVEDDELPLPEEYELSANYPNPFNPTTNINYALPEQTHVRIEIYNMLGERILLVKDEVQSAGRYTAAVNMSDFASGIYIYRIKTNAFVKSMKMALVK